MLTPQEVNDKSFVKATFGGYSMTQVDEFLDELTTDYGTLYSENAVLKSKMKVLVDTVEEYRSTEEAMRKALMSAQRIADDLLHSAEEQKRSILEEAEQLARSKVASIRDERVAEEFRLAEAQRSVRDFAARARATYEHNIQFLDDLASLCPPSAAPAAAPPVLNVMDAMVEDIEDNVQRILNQAIADVVAAQDAPTEEIPLEEPTSEELPLLDDSEDLDFSDLEFGQNYQMK